MDTSTATPNSIRAQVSLRPFLMAAACKAGSKEPRRQLQGVAIHQPKSSEPGVFVVGTDGKCLLIAHDPEGFLVGADSLIVEAPTALITACKKGLKDDEITYKVNVLDDRVAVEGPQDEELFSLKGLVIDDVEPADWWRFVMPARDRLEVGLGAQTVQPYMLDRVAKVGQYTKVYKATSGAQFMRYTSQDGRNDSDGRVFVRFVFDDAFMILMPLNDEIANSAGILFAAERERLAGAAERQAKVALAAQQ